MYEREREREMLVPGNHWKRVRENIEKLRGKEKQIEKDRER